MDQDNNNNASHESESTTHRVKESLASITARLLRFLPVLNHDILPWRPANADADAIPLTRMAAPMPLDNGNLRAALHLFLGEFCDAAHLPFVPSDLRNLIGDYAETHPDETTDHYCVVACDGLDYIDFFSGTDGKIPLPEDHSRTVRMWAADKLVSRWGSRSQCQYEEFKSALQPIVMAHYAHIPTHRLVDAVVHYEQSRYKRDFAVVRSKKPFRLSRLDLQAPIPSDDDDDA